MGCVMLCVRKIHVRNSKKAQALLYITPKSAREVKQKQKITLGTNT